MSELTDLDFAPLPVRDQMIEEFDILHRRIIRHLQNGVADSHRLGDVALGICREVCDFIVEWNETPTVGPSSAYWPWEARESAMEAQDAQRQAIREGMMRMGIKVYG